MIPELASDLRVLGLKYFPLLPIETNFIVEKNLLMRLFMKFIGKNVSDDLLDPRAERSTDLTDLRVRENFSLSREHSMVIGVVFGLALDDWHP